MDQIRIGAFLKALRKEKGLTQEQLAEKLAVSGRTVSRWETGESHALVMTMELGSFREMVSFPSVSPSSSIDMVFLLPGCAAVRNTARFQRVLSGCYRPRQSTRPDSFPLLSPHSVSPPGRWKRSAR